MSFAFFDALFPQGGSDGPDLGYVVLALFPGGRFDPAEGPTQQHYFAWPSQRDELVAFCLHNNDNDIYTVPALFKERGSRKAHNISHMWAAYADADTLKLSKLRAEPTLVVETSPGRHHLYWVTSTDDPERLVEVSRNIAHTHAADGCDKGGWDAGQLLRVPGTTNNKNSTDAGIAWEVQLKAINDPYDIKRLEDLYPKVTVKLTAESPDDMPPAALWSDVATVADAQKVFHYNPDVWDMFSSELREGQDRSATMWRMLGEMARYGTSRTTAMYIAWNAKCNKYRLDGRTEEELWTELCRAFDDPANRPITSSLAAARAKREKIDQMETNPELKLKEFADSISLLKDHERANVPTNTFVDRYVAWAMTRTDAPETYHRSVAVTIMTAIFGEYGSCPTKFDSNLTLWFLLLGPTTRARKTTAMMLGMDLLGDMEDGKYSYLLGSDVTSEALSAVLPKRDGMTSVFYRDEAHGLLYEQDKKRYLAGLREHMTELYGGRVRNALRASNANDSEDTPKRGNIRTNFVMFLCGTMDQVTSALTIDDYQSGHLARFLVAEADPPPMTKDDMRIEQYDGVDRGEDVMRQSILNDLAQARAYWERLVRPRRTTMIQFDSAAWERLMDARWDIYRAAQAHEMAEVLTPTTDRMGTSVMKCSVLLAMADKAEKVQMDHVLKAIALAEEWYTATAKIAGRIMHSSWSAQQEEVLSMVAGRKDGVTEYEIYSRFRARMQSKDIESNITTLVKANEIRRITEKGRIRYIRVQRL